MRPTKETYICVERLTKETSICQKKPITETTWLGVVHHSLGSPSVSLKYGKGDLQYEMRPTNETYISQKTSLKEITWLGVVHHDMCGETYKRDQYMSKETYNRDHLTRRRASRTRLFVCVPQVWQKRGMFIKTNPQKWQKYVKRDLHTEPTGSVWCIDRSALFLCLPQGEVGGWGRDPFSRNLMSPTPRRKWYLTTGRRFH